jgi:hypothetical protein
MVSKSAMRDELDRLGLEGYDLGETVVLSLPSSEASHALGRDDVAILGFATMLATGFVDVPFASVAHPVLRGVELGITGSPGRVVRVSAPLGKPLEIHSLKGELQEGKNIYRPSDDSETAYIDTTETPDLLIRAGSATIALIVGSNALEVTSVDKPIQMVAPAHLEPSVMEWITGSNDSWLSKEVAAKVGAHNSWSRVVAAGMVARLAEPSSAEEARAWVHGLVAGTVDERLAAPRRWARHLSPHETRTVEELALAEVEAMHSEVEAFSTAVDNSAGGWKEVWRDLCHRRDDLECVLVLLDEPGQGTRLRRALTDLDREGDLVRLSVPAQAEFADERMWRTSRKTPGSWWGALPDAS